MNVLKIKANGPPAPKTVPAPGATSAVGHRAPKFKSTSVRPQASNTRNYGKAPAPSPNPFGYDSGGI